MNYIENNFADINIFNNENDELMNINSKIK
jgi:hypothetical protein